MIDDNVDDFFVDGGRFIVTQCEFRSDGLLMSVLEWRRNKLWYWDVHDGNTAHGVLFIVHSRETAEVTGCCGEVVFVLMRCGGDRCGIVQLIILVNGSSRSRVSIRSAVVDRIVSTWELLTPVALWVAVLFGFVFNTLSLASAFSAHFSYFALSFYFFFPLFLSSELYRVFFCFVVACCFCICPSGFFGEAKNLSADVLGRRWDLTYLTSVFSLNGCFHIHLSRFDPFPFLRLRLLMPSWYETSHQFVYLGHQGHHVIWDYWCLWYNKQSLFFVIPVGAYFRPSTVVFGHDALSVWSSVYLNLIRMLPENFSPQVYNSDMRYEL